MPHTASTHVGWCFSPEFSHLSPRSRNPVPEIPEIQALSPEHLDQLLDDFVRDPAAFKPTEAMMKAREEFRSYYFNKVDGKVGARVLAEAIDLVQQWRSR